MQLGRLLVGFGCGVLGACTPPKNDAPGAHSENSSKPTPHDAADAAESNSDTSNADRACGLPIDGSRLSAIRLRADDGSWQFDGWYDTELGQRCAATAAADGVTRCLPGALPSFGYSDANCTQRAVLDTRSACAREAQGPLAYVGRVEQLECASRRSVYALGANLGTGQAFYRMDPNGTCGAESPDADADPSADYELYQVQDEVAPERFVALEHELVGQRLQAMRVTWADGAEYSTGIPFDVENETGCYSATAADGEMRCLPLYSGPSAYADATCTQAVLATAKCPSTLGFEHVRRHAVSEAPLFDGTCQVAMLTHVFSVSEETRALERLFFPSQAQCVDGGDMFAGTYHDVGAELPSTAFALLELRENECGTLLKAGTRLGTVHWVDEYGQSLEGYFFDKELSSLCEFTAASDGLVRCLPIARSYALSYLDAECSREAAALEPCAQRTVVWRSLAPFVGDYVSIVRDLPAECALPRAEIHPLIGAELAIGYRRDNEGNCIQDDASDRVFREMGPQIDPSMFVARSSAL